MANKERHKMSGKKVQIELLMQLQEKMAGLMRLAHT
jgi:hypothetical protein